MPRSGTAPALAAAQVCGGGDAALAPLVSTARRASGPVASDTARPAQPPVSAPAGEATPLPPPPRRTPVAEATELPPLPPREPTPAPPAAAASPAPAAGQTSEAVAQIGAFSSRESAERAWGRLAELFPDLVKGKTMRIDTVTMNGAPMYRTAIAGFASPADALAMCTRLMASSEPCFVRKGP